jgi:hypothetical protein
MSPTSTAQQVQRRGLAALATLAGVGATMSLVALTTSGAVTTSSAEITSLAAAPSLLAPASRLPLQQPTAAHRLVAPSRLSAKAPVAKPVLAVPAKAGLKAATPASSSCTGLEAAVDAFLQHVYAAHLETSPGQQAADALAVDQYAKTHTVMLQNMLAPLAGGGSAAVDAFLQHVYAAHLETSPGQQAADALAVDQYAKTHTVMLQNMLAPLVGADPSSC